ncbi:MAG: hypothetical protein IPP72_04460 [Chitinophagaceae bacterium]|nr:hypothetical protein [Chitinophagaceae bacterium]
MKPFASNYFFIVSLLLAFTLSVTSCKKDSFITSPDAKISTSIDSLKYDTVFTSIGSVTQSFKISNNNDQKILLSSVKVMGGTVSAFKININGVASQEATNVELEANDSIYVFVSVNINPNLDNLPFIVKDSVQISYNGNTRFVQLEAFGQNANFLRNRVITTNTTWNNNLPYVILGSLQVDTSIKLTINAGCKIYCHANAPILVDGTLKANGTKEHPVIFRSDRIDEDYKDLPASWPGIYFRETSKSNELTFVEVRNAYQAIVAENPADNFFPKITLHQCIIDNAYDAGLLCINSSLYADNSLITNCGNNVQFILGGNYNLTNCTIAAYSTFISHKNPVLAANNFAVINGSIVTTSLDAAFTNCIFWGDDGLVENEVTVAKEGTDPFNVSFTNCLYRAANDPANSTLNAGCIRNQNPAFDSVDVSKNIFDFHISNDAAPGINGGIATGFLKDLDNNNRSNGLPDIGCYEKQ